MIDIKEVIETNKMIKEMNLDVRTITLGISLLDCMDTDLNKMKEKIYTKITTLAANLVKVGNDIEREFGVPIVNKRIEVTPISLICASTCKCVEDYVEIAKTLGRSERRKKERELQKKYNDGSIRVLSNNNLCMRDIDFSNT